MTKKLGKIIEFDGFSGTLIDEEKNKYIFLNHDILSEGIKINDIVKFEGELFKKAEIKINIARFVRKEND